MRTMLRQAIRAARLDRAVYGRLETDVDAILHALGTVSLAGIAMALGLMGTLVDLVESPGELGNLVDRFLGVWLGVITAMVGWVLWGFLVYLLGSRFLAGRAGYRILLRALGICYGPGVLLALITVPWVGDAAHVVAALWVLVAGVVAVHEVQEMDWVGAALATVPGWFLGFLVLPGFVLVPLTGGQ